MVPRIVEIVVVLAATIRLFSTAARSWPVDSTYSVSSVRLVGWPKIVQYQSKVKPDQTIMLIGLALKENTTTMMIGA